LDVRLIGVGNNDETLGEYEIDSEKQPEEDK
jgi:hypothetical protein